MLIPQLNGPPFLDVLSRELDGAERLDVATAWVRASGVGLLWPALCRFLDRGGTLRVVAGVDRDNTSREGLAMLLALAGDVRVWVRHNEASPIFHPKLYGFRTGAECRVLVGSNNLTGAGLSQNEELSGLMVEARGGDLERSLDEYMALVADEAAGLALPLDAPLLDRLVAAGYVDTEARLRGKSGGAGRPRPAGDRIFAFQAPKRRRIPNGVPVPADIEPAVGAPSADWRRVFVKLRLARGTQGQLPIPVAREVRRRLGLPDGDGPFTVIDRHQKSERQISPTFPERRPDVANTYKVEAIAADGDAVLKLEMVGGTVLAEFFDTAEADGRAVYDFIIDGLRSDPPATVDPRGAARNRPDGQTVEEATSGVTLYRFD